MDEVAEIATLYDIKELIEIKELIKRFCSEAIEGLRREKTAHLITVTKVERLTKALGVEKQRVHELLEKALHEMRSEYAEIKFTADSKLEEAHALCASVEERPLEGAAHVKLAEVSRKTSEHQRKSLEFELEMEQKRKSLDEEFKSRAVGFGHMEGKIAKREQAVEKKLEKAKKKEKEFDVKLKALKKKEKTLKSKEKNLEYERKEFSSEVENLLSLNVELDKLSSEIEEQKLKINEERERLEVTEEERYNHGCLQWELKQEIERIREERKAVLKERENLKEEKKKIEKEWKDLNEKRVEIKKELEFVTAPKEKIERMNRLEEERLKNQSKETKDYLCFIGR